MRAWKQNRPFQPHPHPHLPSLSLHICAIILTSHPHPHARAQLSGSSKVSVLSLHCILYMNYYFCLVSMVELLLMKILNTNIGNVVSYQWLIADQIRTAHNFLSLLTKHNHLIENVYDTSIHFSFFIFFLSFFLGCLRRSS
jgi:hypothetical protein